MQINKWKTSFSRMNMLILELLLIAIPLPVIAV